MHTREKNEWEQLRNKKKSVKMRRKKAFPIIIKFNNNGGKFRRTCILHFFCLIYSLASDFHNDD